MHRSLLLGAVSALALSSPAFAADMYRGEAVSYKDAPVHVAPHIWTGFYVGVNGGYAWGDDDDIDLYYILRDGVTRQDRETKYDVGLEGAFGGVQLGYNWQRNRYVFGIEADIQASDISADASGRVVQKPNDVIEADLDLEWFSTIRARAGIATGKSLFYITGGFAFGDASSKLVHDYDPAAPNVSDFRGVSTGDETLTGYTIGGGLEHAIDSNWSVKLEYMYVDLGGLSTRGTLDEFKAASGTCSATNPCNNLQPSTTETFGTRDDIDFSFHSVRVGLNYKLGSRHEPLK
jgi:outer membrane immunogenic protein